MQNEKKPLAYGKQWIDDEDIAAVVKVLKSDFLTTGPNVKEFEQKFAEYVGATYAVAVSNGTAALHAAAWAAGIGEGDEVITTPMTFLASANCALYVGATPIFADIDPANYNIDPKEIEKKVTPRTKAIIPVHFSGQACDMDAIHQIANKHNLVVIEDAAHALGTEYKGKRVGGLSDLTTFSFHPVKHITSGEGGMITTNDEQLYKRLLIFRTHGMNRNIDEMENYEGSWYYEMQELGYNYRLTDFQSALGISQLKKSDAFLTRRREIAAKYAEGFANNQALILPHQEAWQSSAWHLYVLQVNPETAKLTRKQAFDNLQKERILANVHYQPVYKHPYYRKLGYQAGLCPVAEKLYENMLSIPMYPRLTDEDVDRVIVTVNKVIGK